MDAKSIYTIVAEQTKVDEYALRDSIVKYLDDEKMIDEMGLIVQKKWNHKLIAAIAAVAKVRIVLFNSKTGKYKDFGDEKSKEKIMIYVRGSELALMRKSAKRNNREVRGGHRR